MTDIIWDSYYGKGNISKINEQERIIGYKFPASYKEVVEKYNGAFIVNRNNFKYKSALLNEEVEYGTGMFLPFGPTDDSTVSMEQKWEFKPEGFPKHLVFFSALGNGDMLCFDYRSDRTNNAPSIVVWHHEGTPGSSEEVSFVSKSFEEFLDSLYEDEDDQDDDFDW
jgi:hypothetical protein